MKKLITLILIAVVSFNVLGDLYDKGHDQVVASASVHHLKLANI